MLTTIELSGLRATEHENMLRKTAMVLLWDWRAAAEIMEATWAKAEANLDRSDPVYGPPGVWVWNNICLRKTIEYKSAHGLHSPLTDCEIEVMLGDEPERATAERRERAELSQRIETLPVVLRAPMRLWLDDEEIPESLGWYVRQGLTLLGRRRAAA